jgi:hypothetical protein
MALSPDEWDDLQALLRQARRGRLAWNDESRLRHLVSKQNPGAQSLPWEGLVDAGLVIVGLYALQRALAESS